MNEATYGKNMTTGVTDARKVLKRWAATVKATWKRACEEDNIDPNSKFVVFSDNNKFAKFYDKAVQEYQENLRTYQEGGYLVKG